MIRINFSSVLSSVFAGYTSTEELKSAANAIFAQVNEAYQARFVEIANTAKTASTPATAPAAPAKPEAKAKKEKTAKPKTAEAPKTETKAKSAGDTDTLVAITDLAAIKKLGLTFEKYNDRCWVLRGDTKPLRKILKEQFKGVFNSHLSGGEGWVIKTANVDECAKALGLKLPKAA